MTGSASRQMTLVAFLQAQNCSNYVGSWRHPAAAGDFLSPEYYERIARTLEDGKFDMAFFDDRLAMPDIYGHNHKATVAHGVRAVKLDPSVILTVMAMATSRLGLGATYSTTYYEPYHVARIFATLDLMSKGRVAWNIVTSLNGSEAANFGYEEHLEHDLRYDRADEFMEVVVGHWGAWEEGSIIGDRTGDRFADPEKVHQLDYRGAHFQSRGPFTVPRSPQGHPVLMQAGQSGRGRAFAARWAELVFAQYANLAAGRKQYNDFKEAFAAAGRPGELRICPEVKIFVGETEALAREKFELLDSLTKPIDALILMCELLNVDFAGRALDAPFNDQELAAMSWQGLRDRVIAKTGKKNPTVQDFIDSSWGTLRQGACFIGTPRQVADEMEEWFGSACDGFVISAPVVPGSYEDFVRLVVPELQRRKLHRTEYPGTTLRETLGLARPVSNGRPKVAAHA